MYKHIIFDFDGTIADTFKAVEEIGKDIAKRYSIKMNSEDAKNIGFKKALIDSKFPKWKLPQILFEIKKRLSVQISKNIKPIRGIKQVILNLSKKFSLSIVSTNSKENIIKFLTKHKIKNSFKNIYSDSSLFSKHIILKKMFRKYKINPKEAIYIGDEDRDIQAARKIGIKTIAVSWGYNSKKLLEKEKPDYLADKPADILKFLKI